MIDLAVEPHHASGTQGLTMTERASGPARGHLLTCLPP
jgi:hypothetical protein